MILFLKVKKYNQMLTLNYLIPCIGNEVDSREYTRVQDLYDRFQKPTRIYGYDRYDLKVNNDNDNIQQ